MNLFNLNRAKAACRDLENPVPPTEEDFIAFEKALSDRKVEIRHFWNLGWLRPCMGPQGFKLYKKILDRIADRICDVRMIRPNGHPPHLISTYITHASKLEYRGLELKIELFNPSIYHEAVCEIDLSLGRTLARGSGLFYPSYRDNGLANILLSEIVELIDGFREGRLCEVELDFKIGISLCVKRYMFPGGKEELAKYTQSKGSSG